MKEIYIHINYFENGYSWEDAFRHAAEIGYTGIEVRDRDRSGTVALCQYLPITTELAQRYGLEVVYGCRVNTNPGDRAVREASLQEFAEVLAHASANKYRRVNVFTGMLIGNGLPYSGTGSALAVEEDWESSVEAVATAADRHPEILFALETHSGYVHDLAGPCRKLLDRINRPNVTANFDFANIYLNRRGESLEDAIKLLKGRIGYVHLKDARIPEGAREGVFDRIPLGEGDIDLPRQLALLKAIGYDGPICVESTMKCDKLPIAHQDFRTLSEWLRDLEANP